jgi:hypothetical protein
LGYSCCENVGGGAKPHVNEDAAASPGNQVGLDDPQGA